MLVAVWVRVMDLIDTMVFPKDGGFMVRGWGGVLGSLHPTRKHRFVAGTSDI